MILDELFDFGDAIVHFAINEVSCAIAPDNYFDCIPTFMLVHRVANNASDAAGNTLLKGNSSGHLIQNNFIGVDVTGSKALGNAAYGLALGGSTSAPTSVQVISNIISANGFTDPAKRMDGLFVSG